MQCLYLITIRNSAFMVKDRKMLEHLLAVFCDANIKGAYSRLWVS